MVSRPAGDAERILNALEADGAQPLRAMIEIADRCNEVCVHCYQEQGLKGEMTTQQVFAVIDSLAELGVLVLTLSGGEATLREDFVEICRHARARGFVLRIFTNGLRITDELAAELSALAVDVVEISVYSHRPQVHDFVTGVPGSFEKTVAGIRRLRQAGVDVHVKTPIMRVNEAELDDYIAFADALGVTFGLDPEVLSPREYATLEPEALSRSEAVLERVLRHPRLGGADPQPLGIHKPLDARLCGAGQTPHIEPNGDIRPCVVLPMNMGNALEPGGLAASHASALRAELTALRWGDVHGCRECDLRSHCHRCHARALAEAGDALAPYPSACENARAMYACEHGVTLRVRGERDRGPYRLAGDALELLPDRVSPADDALAARLGWVRRAQGPMQRAAEHAVPGALVQLRRPGRKRGRAEQVPPTSGEAADAAE